MVGQKTIISKTKHGGKIMCQNNQKIKNKIEAFKLWSDFCYSIKDNCDTSEGFEALWNTIFGDPIELEKEKIFYRARLLSKENYAHMHLSDWNKDLNDSGIRGLSKKEMGAPPPEKTVVGRANPKGVSYLYLATNPEIACSEIQPTLFDLISVAEFELTQDIKVVNLKCCSRKGNNEIEQDAYCYLIENVMNVFSIPVRTRDSDMYGISQAITDKIKEKGFDGIMYGSMNAMSNQEEPSYTLVLFDAGKASCISEYGEVWRTAQKTTVFQNVSVLDEKVCIAKALPELCTEKEIKNLNKVLKNKTHPQEATARK